MGRIENFLEMLENKKLDGFLVTNRTDIRYLCGFSGSAGMLWISPKRRVFITDFRYDTQTKHEIGDKAEIFITSPEKDYFTLLKELELFKDIQYVGFDSGDIYYNTYRHLSSISLSTNLIPVSGPASELRSKKEPEEIQKIRQAAKIAIDALIESLPLLRHGITENEFSAELEYRMKKKGSEKCSFDTIVASGWRAALPHGAASDKVIETGEMIVVDFGATYQGYTSDITRTFFLGTPDEKFKTIYETTLSAQKSAIRGASAGKTGKEIDSIARDIITNAGYGENFGHGLGHGIGLVVHDSPTVNQKNEKPLPENSVVTIEPGIYISNWGGVRIEDDVLITEKGAEVLTKELPKALKDMVIPVTK